MTKALRRRAVWLIVVIATLVVSPGKRVTSIDRYILHNRGGAQIWSSAALAPPTSVGQLLRFRDISRPEAEALLAGQGFEEFDAFYENVQELTGLQNWSLLPGYLFFRGDGLAMVSMNSREYLAGLTPAAIERELGGPGHVVRGQYMTQLHVYPELGFAAGETFLDEAGHPTNGPWVVLYVEIFPPMPLMDYLLLFHIEPPHLYK